MGRLKGMKGIRNMRLVASFAAVASVASAFAAEPRIVALDRNVYHVQVVREGVPAP